MMKTTKPAPDKAQHTPGPCPAHHYRRPYDDEDPEGYLEGFADYAANNRPAVEWFLENYSLCAAAPDLLVVAEQLQEWAEHMGGWEAPVWEKLNQVIARAKGVK